MKHEEPESEQMARRTLTERTALGEKAGTCMGSTPAQGGEGGDVSSHCIASHRIAAVVGRSNLRSQPGRALCPAPPRRPPGPAARPCSRPEQPADRAVKVREQVKEAQAKRDLESAQGHGPELLVADIAAEVAHRQALAGDKEQRVLQLLPLLRLSSQSTEGKARQGKARQGERQGREGEGREGKVR